MSGPPATLTVVSAPVAPAVPGGPQNAYVRLGVGASFYVLATGTAPLSYQWNKNGTPIPDATDPTYTSPPTTSGDNNALFTVTVTNSAGNVTGGPAQLTVTPNSAGGGSGFQLPHNTAYQATPSDLIGVQYRFKVVTNQSPVLKIIFGGDLHYTPGSPGESYNTQFNVYSDSVSFANGTCTTFPPAGTYTEGIASLRNATADYPYQAGQAAAVGSGLNTSDTTNWPFQTYLIDNIPNLYETESFSQFSINGVEGLVTVQRGGTLTDVSSFERCGIPMLPTTYRVWTITAQMTGLPPVVNQIVLPDAEARYIAPYAAMQFLSEFLDTQGTFTVQFWDFAYIQESSGAWVPASTLETEFEYTGGGEDLGAHVVTVNGQDRVEISNVPGNSYLPANLLFSMAPP